MRPKLDVNLVRLGRTNTEVSAVSLGTWSYGGPNRVGEQDVGWSGHDDTAATSALIRAHELGINHWDTADAYGGGQSERLIGEMWGDVPRSDIFLASKIGWDPGEYGHFYHPEQIRKQLERSLRNLKTDVIDLYYLHHCDFGEDAQYLDGALELFSRFKDEGKIRFIGLSDWNSKLVLDHVGRVDPEVIQVCRNVANDGYTTSGLRDWVEENDVGAVFFSALDHGLLLGKYSAPQAFPEGDTRNRVPGFGDMELLRKLSSNKEKLEERFEGHPAPVLHGLIGSLLADSKNSCVLVGQRNPEQVEAAAAATSPLSKDDADWVKSLYR
ncbi:MAG: aldo/keto reductase [Gemmatimonadetes bacterium]|nr:aldo/keto reductase [Gemmatimonadota bacterium]